MIRFIPDTWRDALWRPISMAAPEQNVYAEIAAPDLRFVFIALLVAAWGVLFLWRRKCLPARVVVLGSLMLAAFAVWLYTSGNGRYFIPSLLLAGPLCMSLLYWLPLSKSLKASLALLMLVMQGFVVHTSNPFGTWGFVGWDESPYFELSEKPELTEVPHTFVTITSISYSLISPQFHRDSRWINLAHLPKKSESLAINREKQRFIDQSKDLMLLVPVVPGHSDADGLPTQNSLFTLNESLANHGLAINEVNNACEFWQSNGMARFNYGKPALIEPKLKTSSGFWACKLILRESIDPKTVESPVDATVLRAFGQVEKACPRFFPSQQGSVWKYNDGYTKGYGSSDMKLYVMPFGVFYKYYRGLNPEKIGTLEEVLSPQFSMDCNKLRGRSGLPWEREI